MDKVIIDGVDVSECIYYKADKFANCGMFALGDFKCDGQICLYKQLQRARAEISQMENGKLKMENELAELKAENERLKKDKIGLHSEIKQLEQENFELKESLKCFQTPEAIKALTFYKTGEFEIQEKKCIKLEQENERLKFKLNTVEADYEASEIEIEDLKNKLNLLTTANNHLLELDKYRQKELETKAEATKSNIHNLALLSKAKKTLQEIREIADEYAKKYLLTQSAVYFFNTLESKINEVIGVKE